MLGPLVFLLEEPRRAAQPPGGDRTLELALVLMVQRNGHLGRPSPVAGTLVGGVGALEQRNVAFGAPAQQGCNGQELEILGRELAVRVRGVEQVVGLGPGTPLESLTARFGRILDDLAQD